MSTEDRERWDARHRAHVPRTAGPLPFVASQRDRLPARGAALDVAGGTGRHALWLAGLGLDVTLLDISSVALGLATTAAAERGLQLHTTEVDLDTGALPPGPFDLVLCTYFLWRPLLPAAASVLRPGGLVIVAHPTRRNLERNPSPSARFILEEGELARLVPAELEVLELAERWTDDGQHEAQLVARRRA